MGIPTSTKDGRWRQPWLLLLLWVVLGAGLRLTNLDGKPPWTDEFATLVFSLGNSFKSIPIDRVVSFQDLLTLLIPHPTATVSDVVERVFAEDHHPPTYFVLAHLWMKLFPTDDGLVNLWAARALPALCGILTIPVIYICSYFTFRWHSLRFAESTLIANLTAGMLALSPYGVYISQEARHYSLAILWITISVSCLAVACQYLARKQKLPIPLTLGWIIVNNLGMATHSFFIFALTAQTFGLGLFIFWQIRQLEPQPSSIAAKLGAAKDILLQPCWYRLYVTMLGTAVGVGICFWLLSRSYDPTMTEWIRYEVHNPLQLFNPLFQTLGALVPMMSLLGIEMVESPIVLIISAIIMLVFFVWVIPLLKRGIQQQWSQPDTQIGTMAIAGFGVSALGLYLTVPLLTGMDITRGARYHFVYFPGMMMLIGLALASCWQSLPSIAKWVSGKQAVTIVLVMGLVSGAVVANNYGYRKYYRPNELAPIVGKSLLSKSVLIATTHNSLVEVGEMMGLAREMRHIDGVKHTHFFFAHQPHKLCEGNCGSTAILRRTLDRISRPIDLWLINFHAPLDLPPTCNQDERSTGSVIGYNYRLYHCQPIEDMD
jgi:uncharacterized membrane protein